MPADKRKKLAAKWNKSRQQRLRRPSPLGRKEKAAEMRVTTCPEEREEALERISSGAG
jgi:hypothetical protein